MWSVAVVGLEQHGREDMRQQEREAPVGAEERIDVACGREVVCDLEKKLVREARGWVRWAYTNRGEKG